jgi:hypothetical protein
MAMIDLYDARTASMYLVQGVIRVGTDPVYVDAVEYEAAGKFRLHYHLLGCDNRHHFIWWGDKLINYHPVPLGNLNYGRGVVVAQRSPNRQWKLALSNRTLRLTSSNGDKVAGLLDTIPLADCIKGKYPTLREAREMFDDKHTVAVDRDFAIRTDGKLWHRHCGIVGRHRPVLKLRDDYFWLKETMEKLQ